MIEYYVHEINEYIFREDGVLYQQRTFTTDRCTEYMNSELTLPPGRYSVIAIGNRDDRSVASDSRNGGIPVEGVTHRDDMRLALENCASLAEGTNGHSEKLYHGYKTFTVKSTGISRVRVDMVNAHMTLRFRVTWKNGATPPSGTHYYAVLESVPSAYSLMPEYIYPAGCFDAERHDCDGHDLYPNSCNEVIHHIPHTCYGAEEASLGNALIHREDTKVTVDKEMWGEFITYRVKMDTEPVLKIYSSAATRAEGDEMIIPRAINLRQYLEWYDYQPDHTLKQLYEINIEIDGDKIILMPLNIADWEEGGVLYG